MIMLGVFGTLVLLIGHRTWRSNILRMPATNGTKGAHNEKNRRGSLGSFLSQFVHQSGTSISGRGQATCPEA